MEGSIACFSLGSNMGDRKKNLDRAARLLVRRAGSLDSLSGKYESPPWGYKSDSPYLNCCLAIRTDREALDLMELALEIEKEMGRTREGQGYSDRIIDVDLLLYGDRIMDHPQLILPHPRMSLRRFVLLPLAEILPDLKHPVSGKRIAELLANCPDKSLLSPV